MKRLQRFQALFLFFTVKLPGKADRWKSAAGMFRKCDKGTIKDNCRNRSGLCIRRSADLRRADYGSFVKESEAD